MEPINKESIGGQSHTPSQASVQSNVRMKTDKTWDYATLVMEGKKKTYICDFCQKVIRGGGIIELRNILSVRKIREEDDSSDDISITIPDGEATETEARNVKAKSVKAGKRKATSTFHPFFAKCINDPSQPTIKSAMQKSNALNLCNLFAEIVEMVGEKNVVQMVTDNASNYKLAGSYLCERYTSITWSPCAAHCLNLVLNDVSELDNIKSLVTLASRREVFQGVLDMVEKNFRGSNVIDLTMDLGKFRDSKGTFGRPSVVASCTITRPDEWWKLFGGDTPVLQKFAIRILSQTTSSSSSERTWSVFERIHTKRRNRLEHQRLNDLVFVHYNLRMQNRLKVKRSYDPIDYEHIDKTDFWVVEEEPKGELDHNELDNVLDEQEHEPVSQTQKIDHVVDDNEVESDFRLLSDLVDIKFSPLVYLLIRLALTLPVATVTVERAFSAMNIVKNRLHSKMGDQWMNDNLVAYIEKDVFAEVGNEVIIDMFRKMKSRRRHC
ncbi:hypothetical protein OSB04_un000628 [Centaurea solstitialis]|uniref:HAT C-terminal dimerisation domain-containing protein n=1 Tax=Centaurea solstitialis TaxID=347529 RepID=A0AA38S3S5_9ASTR|nr:hypothetical protein OSB04_un000628 [Centaurea solstitialis]